MVDDAARALRFDGAERFLHDGVERVGRRFNAARQRIAAERAEANDFVLGSLLAGYYISSRGLRKTLFTLCCIFNIPFVVNTGFAREVTAIFPF